MVDLEEKFDISDRLRSARSYLRLSQQQMADKMGVVIRPYQMYEAGDRAPKAESLAILSSCGINVNWLLTGQGEMLSSVQYSPQHQPISSAISPDIPDMELARFQLVLTMLGEWLKDNRKTLPPEKFAKAAVALYRILKRRLREGEEAEKAVNPAKTVTNVIEEMMEFVD